MNPNRSLALDALRGFAILTMVLSGVIPYGVLPAWMYHAQNPPPTHQTDVNLAGFTWVDLVFPLFLFALGAAIPLALGRRLDQKKPAAHIILFILERSILLTFFAIFLQHVRPHVLSSIPDTTTWLTALLGFLILFPLFTRIPDSFRSSTKWSIRICAWIAAISLLFLVRYPNGDGFSLYRSDIILIVLANVVFFGSFLWILTKNNILLRLGFLGLLIALRLSAQDAGWIHDVWNYSPVPWVFKMPYLQYLFIVIPGTIIGDIIYKFMKNGQVLKSHDCTTPMWISLAVFFLLPLIMVLVGLQNRWVTITTISVIALCICNFKLLTKINKESGNFLKNIYFWGVYWLLLGLIFEPFEGGIKKSPATMSYYFISVGLAIFMLLSFIILLDVLKQRWLNILVQNGQNPMIAYVGVANGIWPLLGLTGLDKIINTLTRSPWMGFVRGVCTTIILAIVVQNFSRRKIFWRT